MKAFLIDKPGGSDALYQSTIDLPILVADEVMIETRAIGINPADVKVKMAEDGLRMVGGDTRPLILGWDVAGSVTAVGEAVTEFNVGDRVFGMVNFPGHGKVYAEYVAAPAAHVVRIPEGVSYIDAAATTLAALTALQVLDGVVEAGTKILIHAGSGGVGHFAIQISKAMGAHVITTSSAKNRDFVSGLGADVHIDYRNTDFTQVLGDVDVVFDTQGGDTLEKSLGVVKCGGWVKTIAAMEINETLKARAEALGINLAMHLVHSNGVDMAYLANMMREGTLKPTIDTVFPFDALPDAHTHIESGRTVGKVVVEV